MLNRASRKPSARKPRSRQEGCHSQVEGRILQLRDEGHTWRTIADKINDDGFRAPRGGKWSAPQVFRVAKRLDAQRLEGTARVQRFVVRRRAGIVGVTTALLVAVFTMYMFSAPTGDRPNPVGLSAAGVTFQAIKDRVRNLFPDDNNPEETSKSSEEVGRGFAQFNEYLEETEKKLVEIKGIQEDLIQRVQLIRQILEIANHKLMSARQNDANYKIGYAADKLLLEISAGLNKAEHLEDLQELLANLLKL